MNILITGSASGLGYNVGINLAREGYHVFLTTENDKQIILEEFIRKFSADYFTEGLEELKTYIKRICVLELSIEEITGKEGLELQKLRHK